MKEIYENPLCERYASQTMQKIFSQDNKFSTWRKLWISLAENERKLGIDISSAQIEEMKAHIYDVDYAKAAAYERELRHDVMAHIKTFGDACPSAKGIIHLGATSCYVDDNGDILVFREALLEIKRKLVGALSALRDFVKAHKDEPTLAYTHFQAAQPTTVGKRACLWSQDLLMDLEDLNALIDGLRFPGCKGATGTAASFLNLFDGDLEKTAALEKGIAKDFGFDKIMRVSGQTYTRKVDYRILSVLSGIAQSASKFAGDIRLLSHLKEFDEPFESKQVGSSAMAYKRNPMRSERIASLSRLVIADALNPAVTASAQWLERSLDDSANRRISIPEAFLAVDGILILYRNVISGGTVYPAMCMRHIKEELPFMATENIMMSAVKKGGDRQDLHERIRQITTAAAREAKLEGKDPDVLSAIASDPAFKLDGNDLEEIVDVEKFIGTAPRQAEMFLKELDEVLMRESAFLSGAESVNC